MVFVGLQDTRFVVNHTLYTTLTIMVMTDDNRNLIGDT